MVMREFSCGMAWILMMMSADLASIGVRTIMSCIRN
tara:strand:+ start:208 stop:315 length:108 start_codon:yes stop_codon:yes gene_type:complete